MSDQDNTEMLANWRAGRLAPTEGDAFAEKLARDPEMAGWARLADGIADAEAAGEPAPGEFGWARLSRSIEAEAPAPPLLARRHFAAWQVAAALVVGVGLWQLAVVPFLSGQRVDPSYVTATGADEAAIVRVLFVPTAQEAEIRALLSEAEGTIVDGPSAIGLYSVAGPEGVSAEDLAIRLSERADIVQSATLP